MWLPGQAQTLAGGRIAGHQCKLPSRIGTVSHRRQAPSRTVQTRATARPKAKHQRLTNTQASPSNQTSVVLTAPADVQQASQPSPAGQPRSIMISVDYTSDAEQALQWALDYVVKPGKSASNALCAPRYLLFMLHSYSAWH